MRKTIKLFMWGYQPHFRINLELRARQALNTVAPTLEPRAFLVGVRVPDQDSPYPVCVEPEDKDWEPSLFFGCHSRAENIYKNHPDTRFSTEMNRFGRVAANGSLIAEISRRGLRRTTKQTRLDQETIRAIQMGKKVKISTLAKVVMGLREE